MDPMLLCIASAAGGAMVAIAALVPSYERRFRAQQSYADGLLEQLLPLLMQDTIRKHRLKRAGDKGRQTQKANRL